MLVELALVLLLGMVGGMLTGLIPGIHANLVGVALVALSATLLLPIQPLYLIVAIVAMALTHTFLDFIPSILLGCPDTDTELSILPGHTLLKEGRAYEAIMLTAQGSLAAVIMSLAFAYPAIHLMTIGYEAVRTYIPYILIIISFALLAFEKHRFHSAFIFLLAGGMGFLALHSEVSQPLLPLLTGLFGASSILVSIKQKTTLPKQTLLVTRTKKTKPLVSAALTAPLCSFLPGLGSGQAAIIANTCARLDQKGFLVLLGATNTFVMCISLLALYAIDKTRTGAAIAIRGIAGALEPKTLFVILATIALTGTLAFFLTKIIAKIFTKRITSFNYTKLSLATLSILIIIVLAVSKLGGLIILIVSTLLGYYTITSGIRRTNMMGCLIIPTILYYL